MVNVTRCQEAENLILHGPHSEDTFTRVFPAKGPYRISARMVCETPKQHWTSYGWVSPSREKLCVDLILSVRTRRQRLVRNVPMTD